MDPFSSEGELLNLYNAFYYGQYASVLEEDLSTLSPENKIKGQVFVLRAKIELGQYSEVLAEVENASESELLAVKALALYKSGKKEDAVALVEELIESDKSNVTVQLLGATVLTLEERAEEALTLLSGHQGSLEAVALIVQIHLMNNRTDLATKEVVAAKRWAQDSILVNFAESWVGLRTGGENYQQAYYVYEELAQAPATSSVLSLVGQAVTELHLGRLPEAEVALQQALEKSPKNALALANAVVLAVLNGKDASEQIAALKDADESFPLLKDLEEKSEIFDKAAAKYAIKV